MIGAFTIGSVRLPGYAVDYLTNLVKPSHPAVLKGQQADRK